MVNRNRTAGLRLPQSLLAQIEAQDDTRRNEVKRPGSRPNRKADRKTRRQLAKQRKAETYNPNKRRKVDIEDSRRPKNVIPILDSKTSAKCKKEDGRIAAPIPKALKSLHSRGEDEEDAYIELLEKKLGFDKKKNGKARYGAGFEQDGLLDLLVDLDGKIPSEKEPNSGDISDGYRTGEETNVSNVVFGSSTGKKGDSTEEGDCSDDDEEEEEDERNNEEDGEEDETEWTGFAAERVDSNVAAVNEGTCEYRLGADESPSSKYVAPHLRSRNAADENEIGVDWKLSRLLKGLLNRLSEQNMETILREIESRYRLHRRHDVTSMLTKLIIESTASHSLLLDSYVALHAGLIACLHRVIGVDVAAHFVQTAIASFERHYASSLGALADSRPRQNDENLGKECSNLLVLVSGLYSYHVISCILMYDLIRLILDGNLTELDVELILKLVRGSGIQLRQDDPSALKDIIQIIQSKLADQQNTSSRTRFMVETLNNLKNNKLRKSVAIATGPSDSKERISKFVSGIGKKYQVHAHEPLRVSLNDLHQADTKGKWWLIGAAWGGNPLVEHQASRTHESTAIANIEENALLKLARKQGMNTDIRRSIFVVMMSSDDYVDACDRLSQLGLTGIQQREIIRVLLHCCGNEKSYNPYYALIGQHLCRQSHNHKITLQFCLWDFLRSLGESYVGGTEISSGHVDKWADDGGIDLDRVSSTRIANVARAFAWWIAKDCVAISVLKPLDFLTLKRKTRAFLEQLLVQMFICIQDPSLLPSVSSISSSTALTMRDRKALENVLLKARHFPALSKGLAYFFSTQLRQVDLDSQGMSELVTWSCGVAKHILETATEA